jgi:hypothetical protein
MSRQIVEDENVTGAKLRRQFLLDILDEKFAIDRTIDDQRSEESVEAQSGYKSGGLSVAVRNGVFDTLMSGSPAIKSGHGRCAERLVEEDKPTCIDAGDEDVPDSAISRHVGTVSLSGMQRLFLRLIFSSRSAYHKFEIEVSRFNSRLRSSSVVLGLAATWARMRTPSRFANDRRLLALDFGSNDWPDA